ncbi:hypothetical protein GCM10029992_05970 [Glycomyces albus]
MHAQVLSRVIEARDWQVHRDIDGYGGLCEWLKAKFDFHHRVAADLAAIARHAKKFAVLTEAATSGAARVDQVAYAVRALDKTPAMRLYARTPYREPVTSPSRRRRPAPPRAPGRPVLRPRLPHRPRPAPGRDRSRLPG